MACYDPDDTSPVPRNEYEKRHKLLQDRYETFARRCYKILALLSVGLVLSCSAAAWQIAENSKQSDQLAAQQDASTQVLVTNCETSGNPLRESVSKFGEVLSDQIQSRVEQNDALEKSGVFDRAFSGFDPEELHQLLAEQKQERLDEIQELRLALAPLAPVDCARRYTPK